MKIEIVGKNGYIPSQKEKDYANKKLKKLEEFVGSQEILSARVVLKKYNTYYKTEITIPTKNKLLRAEVAADDINSAIDLSVDKLVSQISRYNDKIKDKMGKKGIRNIEEEPDIKGEFVKEKTYDLEPMTKEEALDQMELLGHDFFIYLDKETKKTTVIYLRDDGNYAIIHTDQKK